VSATLPLRYGRYWLGAGLALLVVIMIVAVLPLPAPLPFIAADKVEHFATFAFLTIWFLGIFEMAAAPRVAAGLVLYGVLVELLQSLTAYRYADPYDVLSDVIGISAGWLLAAAGLHRWCRRVEAWFGAGPP
jgi:VanZ family protein